MAGYHIPRMGILLATKLPNEQQLTAMKIYQLKYLVMGIFCSFSQLRLIELSSMKISVFRNSISNMQQKCPADRITRNATIMQSVAHVRWQKFLFNFEPSFVRVFVGSVTWPTGFLAYYYAYQNQVDVGYQLTCMRITENRFLILYYELAL